MVKSHGKLLKKFASMCCSEPPSKRNVDAHSVDTYTERRTTNEHHEGDLFEVEVEGGLKSRLGSALSAGQIISFRSAHRNLRSLQLHDQSSP